jgi:glycosyltransferase involved in cell wall biosynthesis
VVEGKRVAVVVPAYKEELLVAETIRGIPTSSTRSSSSTTTRATRRPSVRARPATRGWRCSSTSANQGVGGAIATGYRHCRELGIDVTCVMAADNQMDPEARRARRRPGCAR